MSGDACHGFSAHPRAGWQSSAAVDQKGNIEVPAVRRGHAIRALLAVIAEARRDL